MEPVVEPFDIMTIFTEEEKAVIQKVEERELARESCTESSEYCSSGESELEDFPLCWLNLPPRISASVCNKKNLRVRRIRRLTQEPPVPYRQPPRASEADEGYNGSEDEWADFPLSLRPPTPKVYVPRPRPLITPCRPVTQKVIDDLKIWMNDYTRKYGKFMRAEKKARVRSWPAYVTETKYMDILKARYAPHLLIDEAGQKVVKRIWQIVKNRNLLDPKNKQFAICDVQLLQVFGIKRFRAFGMMKHLKHHFLRD